MSKRAATSELNHDNWDKEDEPEEGFGVFQKAKDEVLRNRVIKTAKRHGIKYSDGTGSKASPFSWFTGFMNSNSSASSSPFSFLNMNKNTSTENANKIDDDNKGKFSKESEPQVKMFNNSFTFSPFQNKDNSGPNLLNSTTDQNTMLPDNAAKSSFGNVLNKGDAGKETDKKSQNLEILKDLNLSCNSWITEHLEKNPYCILTPIFRDYEKHLAQLELDMESEKKESNFEIPQFKAKSVSESLKQSSSQESTETASKEEKDKARNFERDVDSSTLSKPTELGILPVTAKKNDFSFGGFFQSSPGSGINLNVGGNQKNDGDGDADEESNEPPKSDFIPVVEEDSIYDKRCKVFVKKDSNYVSKGVGTLFLKPVKDSPHTQLIVRADTSSGNIILNVLLTSSVPVQKTGKNNVMIVCRPLPTLDAGSPPVPVLIRVKTSDDCDEVIKKLEECKGS